MCKYVLGTQGAILLQPFEDLEKVYTSENT